jgi:serine/threonine-protein kinase
VALDFTVLPEEIDSSMPEGTVVRTEPEAGSEAARNSEVKIFISKGNFRKGPNLIGQTEQFARDLLDFQGFTADPDVRRVPTTNPAQVGKVINQDPAAETEWDPSRPVTIVIGIAPQTSTTPPESSPPPST